MLVLTTFLLIKKKTKTWLLFCSPFCLLKRTIMGILLKEALKTLCNRNQWSYAVFWKIGCNNSKLLIWEDCYHEPLLSPFPYRDGEGCWFSSESQLSQLGIQEEDIVGSLINKMIVNSSVNIAGEGIIGRAAFTGNHQWILFNSFTKNAYPPEVYTEVHHQFSAGMQTVVVIPVLPHGVVQLGSFLPIMENILFVNDVKSLILQLGCVPGALLSEDYSAKLSTERLAEPTIMSVKPQGIALNCTPLVASSSNQLNNPSHVSKPITPSLNGFQASVLTPQTHNLNQVQTRNRYGLLKSNTHSIVKTSVSSQQENTVPGAEAEFFQSNLNSCMQQQSVSYDTRSVQNELAGFGQSSLSDCSLKYMEQKKLPGVGSISHANPNMNSSSSINMARMKTDSSHILGQSQGSTLIPTCGGMGNPLRTDTINSSISNLPKVPTAEFSGQQKVGVGLQNDNSIKAGTYSVPNLTSQSVARHMHPEGSDQKKITVDLKRIHDDLAHLDERINDDLLQALKIPSLHLEEHAPSSNHIPGFVSDCHNKDASSQHIVKMNAKHDEACTRPPSSDDLFDIFGVDFKRKLLDGNWNNLLANELDADAEILNKKASCVNMQHIDPDISYSISEAISSSGIFSAKGTDHLLDAVVSRAQSTAKQSSDDLSCRTTVTKISTTSAPSPASKKVISDHVVSGGLYDFPKIGVKVDAIETSSLRSGCSKDTTGNCSQTTSIYGSQLSSWIENGSNVKCENSVSTGYSKRADEVCKGNRKRLKPGENPRPRPKDRQMIQDRVKELREIVPNGAKCSIDALLERTIKHMLFLQSVTKHADKLKQTGESKIISKDGGLLLKDNFEGGATWAYEVGSQSMVSPIIVEDLNHPRQMLVEMLCEERGFFLEIADLIRGLGLTILKGVMEARNDKIWARFSVEANRDVTRMEIFMSLVHLLEQTGKGSASTMNAIDNNMMAYRSYSQATQIPATGGPSSLH